MNDYIIKGATLTNIANAIRSKTGTSQPIDAGNFSAAIATIPTDPSGDCTATNDTILAGYNAYAGGVLRTGTIPIKTSSDLSASGATVTVPSGYYASQVTKSISTGAVSATAYSNGNVHFNVTSAGYVDGSKNTYKQYSTKAATSITPSTSQQTAIAANTLATGAITVKAVDNVSAGNIKAGTSIAGVTGSLQEGFPLNVFATRTIVVGGESKDPWGYYTNRNFAYTVPDNVRKLHYVLVGPGGLRTNDFYSMGLRATGYALGGSGNLNWGTIDVVPGEVLNVNYWRNIAGREGCTALMRGDTILAYATPGENGVAVNNTQGFYAKGGDGDLGGGGVFLTTYDMGSGTGMHYVPPKVTFVGGNSRLTGGGGVNFHHASNEGWVTYANANILFNLIGGHGGVFGGGGMVIVRLGNKNESFVAKAGSTITRGLGGRLGGNGGIELTYASGFNVTGNVSPTSGTNPSLFSNFGMPHMYRGNGNAFGLSNSGGYAGIGRGGGFYGFGIYNQGPGFMVPFWGPNIVNTDASNHHVLMGQSSDAANFNLNGGWNNGICNRSCGGAILSWQEDLGL